MDTKESSSREKAKVEKLDAPKQRQRARSARYVEGQQLNGSTESHPATITLSRFTNTRSKTIRGSISPILPGARSDGGQSRIGSQLLELRRRTEHSVEYKAEQHRDLALGHGLAVDEALD